MKGPVLILLWGALAVAGLLAAAWWVRRRALLRQQGAFPAVAVSATGARRRVVARYDERCLTLHAWWPARGSAWRGTRWALQMDRVPEAGAAGEAVLDVSGGTSAVRLHVDEADAGALRAWCEAGPSQAGHSWWGMEQWCAEQRGARPRGGRRRLSAGTRRPG